MNFFFLLYTLHSHIVKINLALLFFYDDGYLCHFKLILSKRIICNKSKKSLNAKKKCYKDLWIIRTNVRDCRIHFPNFFLLFSRQLSLFLFIITIIIVVVVLIIPTAVIATTTTDVQKRYI